MRKYMDKLVMVMGVLGAGVLAGNLAQAAVPSTVGIAAAFQSSTGAPVVDGVYVLDFALYANEVGGAALWSEATVVVNVKGGQLQSTLGAKTPLTQQILAQLATAWLEVKVEPDPALPRRPVQSVLFALRAKAAEALDCSGCVSAAQLDPSILQPFVKQAALADVATSGAYADLKGLPGLAKIGTSCGTGLVVKGLKADGTLECITAIDKDNLPPDGLAAVSNGLLTDQFTDVMASAGTVDIADNKPLGVSDTINVPDLGLAQKLTVSVDLVNSDVSTLNVTLFDPDNKAYVLYDKGNKGAKLQTTWPVPTATVSGDLTTWVGKNPKGAWKLVVTDSGFLNNTTDGKLNSWNVTVQTLSSKKVSSVGTFIATGGFQFQVASAHPLVCTPAQFGYAYANPKDKALYVCNGAEFYPIALVPIGTAGNPAVSCKDVMTKAPASKDGLYWLTAGGATFQTYCDMTTNGGGWTLAARMVGGSWCHIGADPSGALTSPGQGTCAKLSDAAVKALYSDQFWLTCGTVAPSRWGKIDNIANWNTTSATGNKTMTWADKFGGATYSGTDHPCCNFGDHDYHSPSIIYSIAPGYNGGNYKADWSGCYNVAQGWAQSGYLYVR